MTVFANKQKLAEYKYKNEEEFERDIYQSYKLLFGGHTIFIDAKKKIVSKTLGGTIPDGFFFDLSDRENPEFYLVEVELSSHSFFNHIFPQITKFFAFYKNTKKQKELIEKLFSVINEDVNLRREFKKYLGEQEIFKFLSDTIDNSQNILLLMDGEKGELPEVIDTYSDTWGRMVKPLVVKKFVGLDQIVYTMTPDFEAITYINPDGLQHPEEETPQKINEEFHLEGIPEEIRKIYEEIKRTTLKLNPGAQFNPQKYYISIRTTRNVAFLKIRKKKLRIIAMMEEEEVRKRITHYSIKTLSAGVQNFYNGPCAGVEILDLNHFAEIEDLLKKLLH